MSLIRTAQDMPFSTLLYRYFFFGWLFRDVSSGNMFERAAAMRYNREQARWLPTYMLRWLWLGLAFYVAGEVADVVLQAPALSTWCFAVSSLSVPFTVVTAVVWVALRGLHRSS